MSILLLTLVTAVSAEPVAIDRPVSALTAIRQAATPDEVRHVVERFVRAAHWRDRNAIGRELAAADKSAVGAMLFVVQTSDDSRLARDAFQWLRKQVPAHPFIRDFILHEGLTSPVFSIRYESLWHVGEQRWDEARPTLLALLSNRQDEPYFRFVAAKSLAELGDARALPTLLEAARNDRYMPRHFGNLGLKALTGKNLNDFGYEYGEGAFVSGGVEARMLNPDPLETADKLARRHTACRDYLQWLHDKQPELYGHLITNF